MTTETAVTFEGVTPILPVRSLSASVEHYVQVLGFELDWQAPGILASVSRGRCSLFLCQGDQGNFGTWVWIGVTDAEALFAEYRASGAAIRHPPTSYRWAFEMQVTDLDGNVLRMGSEPKEDGACGEWLDMHGHRWQPATNGGWVRVDE